MLATTCLLFPLLAATSVPTPTATIAAYASSQPVLSQGATFYGSTGLDGDLNVAPGESRVIDLRSNGTYDADNWLVKFNYNSVSIGAGATVSFVNHGSKAPVVWLVVGDVNIAQNAVIELSGENARTASGASFGYAEPGPGGFRGGKPAAPGVHSSSAGFGPGGARGDALDNDNQYRGGGASFRVQGSAGSLAHNPSRHIGSVYGSASLYQLIGGSGGGASRHFPYDNSWRLGGGGAGGGAILIAADGGITVAGRIKANGGSTTNCGGQLPGGPGSGGAIRLASRTNVIVTATGALEVQAGTFGTCEQAGGTASEGRVRVESPGNLAVLQGNVPSAVSRGDSTLPAIRSQPPRIWVSSIGGIACPDWRTFTAGFGDTGPADTVVSQASGTDVVVDSTGLPLNTLVYLRIGLASSNSAIELGPVTLASGTSVVFSNVNLQAGYSALQARAVLP